jgi:hypothetical protein
MWAVNLPGHTPHGTPAPPAQTSPQPEQLHASGTLKQSIGMQGGKKVVTFLLHCSSMTIFIFNQKLSFPVDVCIRQS